MCNSILPHIFKELIKDSAENYRLNATVTDEILLRLHSVFGNTMEKSMDLIDRNRITVIKCQTQSKTDRIFIQVIGSAGAIYTLYDNINYCPCLSYQQQVLLSPLLMTCKHVLAAALARVWSKHRTVTVSQSEFLDIFQSSILNEDKRLIPL